MPDESAAEPIERWTAKRRATLVLSILKGESSVAEAARRHGLTVAEIEGWRDRFLLGGENVCLTGHQFASLAEAPAIIEAWRIDDTHRRPHRSFGHLTPSEFVTHRQTLRIAEAVACSGYDLSRKGTNITCILMAEFPTIMWCMGQSWQEMAGYNHVQWRFKGGRARIREGPRGLLDAGERCSYPVMRGSISERGGVS